MKHPLRKYRFSSYSFPQKRLFKSIKHILGEILFESQCRKCHKYKNQNNKENTWKNLQNKKYFFSIMFFLFVIISRNFPNDTIFFNLRKILWHEGKLKISPFALLLSLILETRKCSGNLYDFLIYIDWGKNFHLVLNWIFMETVAQFLYRIFSTYLS